jgi:arginyl-tRNA synthetase
MVKDKIAQLLQQAVIEAQQRGLLPPLAVPEVSLERPQNPEHGDYASTMALRLGRVAQTDPLAIAETIAGVLPPAEEVETVSVVPPGFINFVLSGNWLAQQVEEILSAGERYGDLDLGQGSRVQLEFVSVNPTGPLHVGHGRGAVLGSTLASILGAAGYEVQREYYINDAGSQMDAFYRSLYARYCQALGHPAEMPVDGYYGDYMVELAEDIIAERGDAFLALSPEEAIGELGRIGLAKVMESIKSDLELLGIEFDVWFSEKSLYEQGQFERAMSLLRQGGYIGEKEGALWFVSTALGEDKDNVLVRTSGVPTYLASDVAYHYNKFLERGFDTVIDVWGADHQGHISRMKAVASALGVSPERLQIIIAQMVSLRRGEALLRASKRAGEIITLRELVDEVGPDVCRFFFLSRAASSQMDFDLELAKQQSMDNPVYYVQYAHARIASILRLAEERNIDYAQGDVALLVMEPELTLIRGMIQLPEIIEMAARNLEPHHLPYYAQELATVFHSFYKQCRVVSADEPLTLARLKLVAAAKIVLAKTLDLMGMTAPEQM